MSRPLPIGSQIASMKAAWPMFKVKNVGHAARTARWVGEVRPHLVPYRLEIRLRENWPEVRILSPELKTLPDNVDGLLPHVFPPIEDPTLCLFDPKAGEWNPTMAISATIVPWAIDWIACYEFWLMNGEWKGGGRHPPQADREGAPK